MGGVGSIYPWGDSRRFNSYSRYFRDLMGGRVQKVAVNAGFTCPNRDGSRGTGGCTFCRNDAFTPSYCMKGGDVLWQVREGIEFHRRRYRSAEQFLVYFQSFSNTYAPLDALKKIYEPMLELPEVAGIVVGTRPDCVDDEKLDWFAELARSRYVAIEYGIESCCDNTLLAINRGHDFACAQEAVRRTAGRGLHTGGHFILGLPGETDEMLVAQTEQINALPLTTVKFHQLQIFKDTPMATDYAANPGNYHLRTLPEYLDLFTSILRRLRPDLVVERFAGEAPPRYHEVPGWGPRNEELLDMFERHLEKEDAWQGELYAG